jgi:hypothetical protein
MNLLNSAIKQLEDKKNNELDHHQDITALSMSMMLNQDWFIYTKNKIRNRRSLKKQKGFHILWIWLYDRNRCY